MAVQQAVPGMAVDETDPDAAEVARLAANMPSGNLQLIHESDLYRFFGCLAAMDKKS